MHVTVTVPPKGRLIMMAWVAIPCAALLPFFFWRGIGWGLLLLCLAAGGMLAAWLRAVSFVAAAENDTLHIYGGVVFPTEKHVPRTSLCGMARLSSPLLRLAGCRCLSLYTAAGTLHLLALARADAEALCTWAQAAPGSEAEA